MSLGQITGYPLHISKFISNCVTSLRPQGTIHRSVFETINVKPCYSLTHLRFISDSSESTLSSTSKIIDESYNFKKIRSRNRRPRFEYKKQTTPTCNKTFDPVLVETLMSKMKDDMPLGEIQDPFSKDYKRCNLCTFGIKIDHKNVRLLSQFVSPFTGRIYGRAITGLCIPMQKHVARSIKRSRLSGYMPIILKDPKYLRDPQPYDVISKK
ncbi:uncharacterized protein LOC131949084 [Physella acuta]|uniref:uncharacterized protein LOC131949084 n=1 Tax=Physella acuta TaxID=109671 RepID=UPI0027DBBEC1|nr:uncharacterized protein LOC131949084 [Physella acuta]